MGKPGHDMNHEDHRVFLVKVRLYIICRQIKGIEKEKETHKLPALTAYAHTKKNTLTTYTVFVVDPLSPSLISDLSLPLSLSHKHTQMVDQKKKLQGLLV